MSLGSRGIQLDHLYSVIVAVGAAGVALRSWPPSLIKWSIHVKSSSGQRINHCQRGVHGVHGGAPEGSSRGLVCVCAHVCLCTNFTCIHWKSSRAKIHFETTKVFNGGRQVAPISCSVISRELGILIKCVDLQVAACSSRLRGVLLQRFVESKSGPVESIMINGPSTLWKVNSDRGKRGRVFERLRESLSLPKREGKMFGLCWVNICGSVFAFELVRVAF